MVFFSSCNSVKFHSELLNYIDIAVMDIHVSDVTIATRGMGGGVGVRKRAQEDSVIIS